MSYIFIRNRFISRFLVCVHVIISITVILVMSVDVIFYEFSSFYAIIFLWLHDNRRETEPLGGCGLFQNRSFNNIFLERYLCTSEVSLDQFLMIMYSYLVAERQVWDFVGKPVAICLLDVFVAWNSKTIFIWINDPHLFSLVTMNIKFLNI